MDSSGGIWKARSAAHKRWHVEAVTRLAAVCIIFGLVVPGSSASIASENQASASAQEIVDEVSGSEMMGSIEALQDFGPAAGISSRAFYLSSTENASVYIYDRLANLGLHVRYQTMVLSGHEVRNVIGVMNGTDTTASQILFGAHYDSENYLVHDLSAASQAYGAAPGADDDASGVAAVLEIARVLHERDFRNTIKFVAFTAEEGGYDNSGGLKGSAMFASSERSAGVSYSGTAIMDMIGYKSGTDNVLTIVEEGGVNLFADSIADAVNRYGIHLSIVHNVDPASAYSDHYPFWVSGYPSILLIEQFMPNGAPVNPYYHTANDTYDKLSEDQLVATVKATVGGALNLLTLDEGDGINIYLVVLVVIAVAVTVALVVVMKKKVA